ncbi:hypothetical protein K474DRAFT_1678541, partial [Panus rudis PR-1116 ss-1]
MPPKSNPKRRAPEADPAGDKAAKSKKVRTGNTTSGAGSSTSSKATTSKTSQPSRRASVVDEEEDDRQNEDALIIEVRDSGDEDAEDRDPSEASDHGEEPEDAEAELDRDRNLPTKRLARLSKSWTSTVYSFYKADVSIIEKDGRRGHVFACYNKG